eukprot:SAG31_NODE_237_length_19590_cov_13.149915_19_plen_70_part_00
MYPCRAMTTAASSSFKGIHGLQVVMSWHPLSTAVYVLVAFRLFASQLNLDALDASKEFQWKQLSLLNFL